MSDAPTKELNAMATLTAKVNGDRHSAGSSGPRSDNGVVSPETASSVSITSSPGQASDAAPSPANSTVGSLSPAAAKAKKKRKKFRARTQSEGAAWARASLRMEEPTTKRVSDIMRSSEGSVPRLMAGLLETLDYSVVDASMNDHDPTTAGSGPIPRKPSGGGSFVTLASIETVDKMQRVQKMSREGCISMWLEQGKISARASEMLEDARLSLHGKEKNLYQSSARRLSAAQDPMLSSLGEKLASSSSTKNGAITLLDAPSPAAMVATAEKEAKLQEPLSDPAKDSSNAIMHKTANNKAHAHTQQPPAPKPQAAPTRVPAAPSSNGSATMGMTNSAPPPPPPSEGGRESMGTLADTIRQSDFFRPESATLYHEAVRWEGVLSRRSEWLRRLEKHYYVLEGKYLRRFASKEAYIASRDEPLLQESERSARRPSTATSNPVSHLYILAGVKESSTRTNGFTLITEDKKTLQLSAPTAVEKVIWMRLGLEAIVAIPNLPVAPLDMEEFYAMIVVLYTAHSGKWRTEGDMAVTLPPPSEQVFTRFFRLLDRDVIFCSNYPPSVPFHGAFRGHAGVVSFIHEFSKHTNWTNFKIGGLSVEGSIAVASGKEELENKRDNRRFVQNWVHKFMFYSDGRLARFEINGDVVAASAVFKVPGAATTLKLPQEFNEVDAEHGKLGTLLVHIMHGSGLRMGVNTKRLIKEPVVVAALHHAQQAQQNGKDGGAGGVSTSAASSAATTLGGISMPTLTRKFSSGISLLSGNAAAMGTPSAGDRSDLDSAKNPSSTGTPRFSDQASYSPMNPVWNKIIELPFHDIIGTCTLTMELIDQGAAPGTTVKVGLVTLNVAKYIMSSHTGGSEEEEDAMASDARWYTVSNTKGEYCGKVMVGMTCRRGSSNEADAITKPRLRKSRSVVIDKHNPPTATMMQWDAPMTAELVGAMTPASNYSGRGATTPGGRLEDQYPSHSQEYRRHGWANVKLSPENAHRPRSDGATSDKGSKKRETAPKPGSTGRFDSVTCKENEDMHTFMVCGAPFTIPKHYQLIKVCGRGAYGIVIAATNSNTGGNVGIKKVIDCVWHPHQLKQILRETRLMRHMNHENILSLMDLIPPSSYSEFRDVYMTVDLMEMDLHRIIYSKEVLLDDHIRYFLYQILSGLNHMHQAGVLHRDLKPSNLLINSDCLLKICDLGLARSKDLDDNGMTEYVVTRWYRAPELLLGSAYGEAVDLWAAGCIFAEMLGRKPLFPGETYVHQLQLIMNVLGVPEEHSFRENPQANKLKGRQLLSRTQAGGGIDVSSMFPNANPEGLDLLWKMLVFDVDKRISVKDALKHPYLAAYYDEEKENRHVERFQSFDLEGLDESELKELMFKEICYFHPEEMEKRAKLQAENPDAVEKLPPGWVKRESRSVPGKFYYSNPKRGISTWIKEEMD
jgi:serine/threonine protein kinase